MAVNPSQDIRAMLVDFSQPVIFAGATVQGIPGAASVNDALGGEGITAGKTRSLIFAAADVPTLTEGSSLMWSGQSWRVNSTMLLANGYAVKAFLGRP